MGQWADLQTLIEADLATGNWRTQSYTIAGRTRSFQSLTELMQFYDWVAGKAVAEAAVAAAGGTAPVVGRTYARPLRD